MKVSSPPFLLCVLSFLLHAHAPALGGHVLVFPGEYSHWLNMRTILDELVKRNHSVTILIADQSPSVDYNNSRDAAKFNFLVFKVPFLRSQLHGVTEDLMHFSMYESHLSSPLQNFLKMTEFVQRATHFWLQQCDAILKNEQLMATLREAAFDAVLLDPMAICANLVADVLGLPLIISLRFSYGSLLERHCGHVPAPPSFVPSPPLPYSDHMTFLQRLASFSLNALMSAMATVSWRELDNYYSEIKGSPATVCDTMGKADVWLLRTYWDLETPRPTVPNFQYVGGLHCKPAKKLPENFEEFVQSSGDAGVVVVSFGTMVPNLTAERADVMAAAFGRIPQKVIWRYSGETPRTLSANTKLFDWIPQNDLLGHPKTRAFVTHGGTNGLYEAVYHAVPVVGIPLFGDQPDNLARLSRRGAGIVLHFNYMTSDELTEALNAVINQPGYKSSSQHLSALHRDRPVTPLNTAVFWVEFVMRHGGARHLRLASHNLNWFQYHSLDTGAALLVAIAIAAAIFWWSLRSLMRCCRRRPKAKKD